ncbi:MAG: radical SAM protein [Nitrospirota bacterium]
MRCFSPLTALNEKKILLVHPLGYKRDTAHKDISRLANIMPPLGLAGIAAYLEKHGFQASIMDCFAMPDSELKLRDLLNAEHPAFIGFSCTTANFLDGIRLAQYAKGVLPGIKTVFGGTHVSALNKRIPEEYPAVDFVIVGEGEEVLRKLMESAGADVSGIQGLVYRLKGEIHFNGFRQKLLDLDTLPFPAYEKLPGYPGTYTLPIFNYPKTPNSSCISSRGCPYQCSYCDRSVFRRSYRYNSAGYVYEHMLYLNERFGLRHLNFYDDQFTLSRKRTEELMTLLIDRPLGMTFNCAVRAEHIDMELLRQMKAAGCWMISLGIETGDENLLARHRQNVDLSLMSEKIRLINKAGIRVKGLLMMGLPGETESSIRKTMEYVFSLPVDDFNIARFTPYPGSPLYERIHELGEFDEDWEKMDGLHFQFIPKEISRERMEKLYHKFYRTHFMRPKVLFSYFTMLWRSPDSWLRFMENAGTFLKFALKFKRF